MDWSYLGCTIRIRWLSDLRVQSHPSGISGNALPSCLALLVTTLLTPYGMSSDLLLSTGPIRYPYRLGDLDSLNNSLADMDNTMPLSMACQELCPCSPIWSSLPAVTCCDALCPWRGTGVGSSLSPCPASGGVVLPAVSLPPVVGRSVSGPVSPLRSVG